MLRHRSLHLRSQGTRSLAWSLACGSVGLLGRSLNGHTDSVWTGDWMWKVYLVYLGRHLIGRRMDNTLLRRACHSSMMFTYLVDQYLQERFQWESRMSLISHEDSSTIFYLTAYRACSDGAWATVVTQVTISPLMADLGMCVDIESWWHFIEPDIWCLTTNIGSSQVLLYCTMCALGPAFTPQALASLTPSRDECSECHSNDDIMPARANRVLISVMNNIIRYRSYVKLR